ncbi:hypothetical protein IMZ11_35435 [Microtetraspora sp. AC03309]|uniref:hypothetical protein n=1 Tax=Microtetraspora sp. AC03309 TaxID=2779376 RepID=UPI001E4D86AB|nr:hypothetical protein [Microtetraspora sp. AC03309]MCC5580921.1 hypothetical protein [Microtetraspora sp. AC03309]
MITRRRISALVLAAVCAAVPLTAFSASAAQAGAAGFGPTKCSPLTNGDLCATGISGSPAGYDAAYAKHSGSKITARFRLMCINGFQKDDNGAFSISAGQRKSFVFSVGNQGSCRVRMHDQTNGSYFYSPYVVIP